MAVAGAPVEQGSFGQAIGKMATFLFSLLFAMLLAVVFEWLGMNFWWQDQRLTHAEKMYHQELAYLQKDFSKTFLSSDTVNYAKKYTERAYYYMFEFTQLTKWTDIASKPAVSGDTGLQATLYKLYVSAQDYLHAGKYRIFTYFVRLAVLTLALPLFLLVALVAMTDGLVQRDVRRWSGGRESSLLFSASKDLVLPSIVWAWIVYLAFPISIHPNFVILPFAVLFAVSLAIMIRSFKKYL